MGETETKNYVYILLLSKYFNIQINIYIVNFIKELLVYKKNPIWSFSVLHISIFLFIVESPTAAKHNPQ